MLVLDGLIMGWLAEVVSRRSGYGFIRDTAMGLAAGSRPARAAQLRLKYTRVASSARAFNVRPPTLAPLVH